MNTQRIVPVHPDQVTRFFSADELMSRRERLEQRGFSTERPTIRGLPVAPTAFAGPPSESRVDEPRPRAPDVSGAAMRRPPGNDEPVDLPYLWARPSLLARLRALPPRRVLMLLLVLLSLYRVWVRPISVAPRRARVTDTVRLVAAPANVPKKPEAPPAASDVAPPSVTPIAPQVTRTAPAVAPAEKSRGPTLERVAVDAVGEGRYGAALDAYRKLSTDDPSKEAYRDAVRILTDRLAHGQ